LVNSSGNVASVYSLFFMPLNKLSGIGPALEKRLALRDVKVLGDLLFYLPRTYVQSMGSDSIDFRI